MQALSSFSQVIRCHAEITSGAYKLRKTQRGTFPKPSSDETIKWRDCTDEEKLQNVFGEMYNHLERIRNLTDSITLE